MVLQGRPRWELIVDAVACDPAEGVARDVALAVSVSRDERPSTMRLWQPDRPVLLLGANVAGRASGADAAVHGRVAIERSTPGATWFAPGPAVLLWSVTATRRALGLDADAAAGEAAGEWVLASLRQLGLQVSLHESSGEVRTPMGPVGRFALDERDGMVVAQGIVDYAITAADRDGVEAVETENVRSQSGLPLALVVDRFVRMARTLYRAAPGAAE